METTDRYPALRTRDLCRFMLGYGGDTLVDVRVEGEVVTSIAAEMSREALVLEYTVNGGEQISDEISIEYSPCHYGGERPWLICPGCRQRKSVLFCDRYFRCRNCLGLTYASLQRRKVERPLNRLARERKRLGGSGSLWEPFPPKPKGMRWENYLRRLEEDQRDLLPSLTDVTAALERRVSAVARRPAKESQA
jgi:hypothetical protein